MVGDAADDVDQPGFWFDAVEPGGLDEAVDAGGAMATPVYNRFNLIASGFLAEAAGRVGESWRIDEEHRD